MILQGLSVGIGAASRDRSAENGPAVSVAGGTGMSASVAIIGHMLLSEGKVRLAG